MNIKEITLPRFNLWRYAFTLYLIQKCKNDIVELNKFVEFPQSHIPSTKLSNSHSYGSWFKVVNFGALTHLRKVTQEYIILFWVVYQIGVLRRLACPSTWWIGPASWEVWVKLVTADCKKSLIWSTVSEDQHLVRSNSFNSSHHHQGLHNVIILVTSPEGLPATSHGWPVTSLVKSGSSPNNVGNPRQYSRHLLDLSVRENHGGTRQVG